LLAIQFDQTDSFGLVELPLGDDELALSGSQNGIGLGPDFEHLLCELKFADN